MTTGRVIAVTGGTHDEFREYVIARGPALLRAARRVTGNPNDAEDLLQAALAKTYLA
ncbi:RNA polymerase sigma factor [Planomonospora sphaerica]|uniref:RNA polymerase sigma factor n=2 Tax=Planomonospora TaxID=1998 RepID=A0A171D812_9ACTN|nr:RNA polymerase sigma factor [Planomonospora sphaerica]